jgi:hypothetical protein
MGPLSCGILISPELILGNPIAKWVEADYASCGRQLSWLERSVLTVVSGDSTGLKVDGLDAERRWSERAPELIRPTHSVSRLRQADTAWSTT